MKKNKHFKKMGQYLKKKRESLNMSQLKLSQKLGYENLQIISNYERGLCFPPAKKMPKIVKALKLKEEDKTVICEIIIQRTADSLKQMKLN